MAINASELRIGNLLCKSLKSGNGRKVDSKINVQDIVRIKEDVGSFNYEPIPLTDEWFLRFGFSFKVEELGVKFYEKQIGIDFLCFSEVGHWNINSGKSYWYMDRNFKSPKYVHDLQNLYWCLCKEELEVLL